MINYLHLSSIVTHIHWSRETPYWKELAVFFCFFFCGSIRILEFAHSAFLSPPVNIHSCDGIPSSGDQPRRYLGTWQPQYHFYSCLGMDQFWILADQAPRFGYSSDWTWLAFFILTSFLRALFSLSVVGDRGPRFYYTTLRYRVNCRYL